MNEYAFFEKKLILMGSGPKGTPQEETLEQVLALIELMPPCFEHGFDAVLSGESGGADEEWLYIQGEEGWELRLSRQDPHNFTIVTPHTPEAERFLWMVMVCLIQKEFNVELYQGTPKGLGEA